MKQLLLITALVAVVHTHAQTITECRYWINDDPSTLVTMSIPPATEVQLNATLLLPTLDEDFNTVTVQMKDGNGDFSVPYTALYSKGTGAVNGYEYWIDDAIGTSTSGSIGPDGIVDLIDELPTGTTSGTHLFTIRFSSAKGAWSVPMTTQFDFFTSIPELPGVNDLLLFPNPVQDQVTLRLDASVPSTYEVSFWDATGRRIAAPSHWSVQGLAQRTWDTSTLAFGSYNMRISNTDHAVNIPFIKR
jgi:hypothetical protein